MTALLRAARRPVALVASAALVAGVGVLATVTAGTASPSTGQTPKAAPPVSDAQVQAAIDQLDTIVADIMDKSGVPGMSVAVTWKGSTVYAKGFGVREVGKPALVDADTVFQLASVSKSVGATVVAREVSKGTVSWDTKVTRYLPKFALADPYVTSNVTIGDMYAHRSGLREHAGDQLEDLGFTQAQVLRQLRLEKLHSFRDVYAYTNFGMTAAGVAVANAAGLDWASLSQRDIYGPLDMTSTSSRFADYISRKNRAVTHRLLNGVYVADTVRQPDAESPAAGVSSSARDMAKWLTMVLHSGQYDGQQIVGEKALVAAGAPRMISGPSQTLAGRSGFYGYGFNVDTTPAVGTRLSHSGAFSAGAATNFVALPGIDLGIVVLTNGSPVGAPEAVAAEFSDLAQNGSLTLDWWTIYHDAYTRLAGPTGVLVSKPRPTNPAPSLRISSYTGVYGNAYYGAARVYWSRNALWLQLGPNKTTYRLRHWSGSRFTFVPTGESAMTGSLSIADFGLLRSGRTTKLTLEFYNNDSEGHVIGLGVWRR